MKDIYKNPILYYIGVPIIVGLWPLLVWTVYLPTAQKSIKEQTILYKQAESKMMEILTLDPERLEFTDSNDTTIEFTYGSAVDRVAVLCDIPPSKHKLNTGNIQIVSGQKRQSANVALKQIDIVTFSRFLTEIQYRWPNLQCERVKLSKQKDLPDIWDVDIELEYYY